MSENNVVNVELAIAERIMLQYVLSLAQGNIINIKTLHNVKMMVALTDEEQDYLQITIKGGDARWNEEREIEAGPKTFEMSDRKFDLVKTELQRQSDEGKLNENHIPLYEKFHGEVVLNE